MDVRLKKLAADLYRRKARTLFTTLGLVIGLWGLGSVLVARQILQHDLAENYAATTPANLVASVSGLTPEMVDDIAALPQVKAAERRPLIDARIEIAPDRYLPLVLFVVDDFDDLRVNTFVHEEDAWPPRQGTLLVERDGLSLVRFMRQVQAAKDQGQPTGHGVPLRVEAPDLPWRIRLPGGLDLNTDIVGTVFDPGQAPSRMEQMVYGYVTRSTADAWLSNGYTDRLLVRTAPEAEDDASVNAIAAQVEQRLVAAGADVHGFRYPPVDQHPHQFQMNSILTLLLGLGLAAFALSAVLVINLVVSLLTNQIRQIGSLKAIGASAAQVAVIYLGSMVLLGLIAVAIALPLSVSTGYRLARMLSAMLNFEVLTYSLPLVFYTVLAIGGVLYPVLAAIGPVRRWSRVSTRAALENHGVAAGELQGSVIDRLPLPLPLTLRLGLRNALRRPGRFVLGVVALSAGALVFMAAMNLRASLLHTADIEEDSKRYDLAAAFEKPVEASRIAWMSQFKQVESVELWMTARAEFQYRERNQSVTVIGVEPDTRAFLPQVQSGQWIDPGRPDGVVASHRWLDQHADYRLGDRIHLDLQGRAVEAELVGTIRLFGPAALYAPGSAVRAWTGAGGDTGTVALVTLEQDGYGEEAQFAALLDQHFDLARIPVDRVQISKIASRVIRNHLVVIEVMLGVVAALILIVSTLGLASGIATAMVERTREIGVMRAIGATPGSVLGVLSVESLFMAVTAWLLALTLANPLSEALTAWFGAGIVEYPFDYATSVTGLWASALALCVLALLATFGPALRVIRQPVREAVGYE